MKKFIIQSFENRYNVAHLATISRALPSTGLSFFPGNKMFLFELENPIPGYTYDRPGVLKEIALAVRHFGSELPIPGQSSVTMNAYLPKIGSDFSDPVLEFVDMIEITALAEPLNSAD